MKKVLVIENDLAILDIVGLILSESDFELVKFQDVIPIQEIIEINPNIIVIDYLLDGVLGTDYCLEIKSNPLTKHIPVVIFSAFNGIEQIANDSCADGYIAKPFDIEYLKSKITDLAL